MCSTKLSLSHGSNPQKGAPEPWLKPPQKRGPEPWLKPQKKGFVSHGSEGFPSHGSNPKKMGSRAMAQTQLCTAHFNINSTLFYAL